MKKNSVVDTRGLKASKKPKQFGDLRFDYIRSCKHEYGNSDSRNAAVAEGYVSCPFCKLINSTTQKFFAQEIKSRRVEREKSVLARAKLRLSLLLGWSRCHSSCYTSKDFTPSVDIVVSKSLAEWTVSADKAYLLALIGSRSSSYQTRSVRNSSSIYHTNTTNNTNSLTNNTNNNIDYREAYRLLQRKKRVKEVGNFAALFLQSRIRKVITKRKLRKLLLQRFEYVPPTRKKDAFFVDTKKNRKWQSLPAIMHDEAPGTPRTISRRMNMEQRKAEKKYYNYYSSVKRLFMSNQSYLRMLYGNQNLVKSYNQTAARISDGSHFAKEFSLDQVSSELLSRVLLLEEEKVIKFLKQVVLLRDLAEMAMREMTNWRRPTTVRN